MSHRRSSALLFVAILGLCPSAALAQAGLPGPLLDLGLDTSIATGSYSAHRALAPRLTFNLAPDLSVTARGEVLTSRQQSYGFWSESRTFDVELRRVLHQSGAVSADALVGIGRTWHRQFSPGYTIRVGSQFTTQPDSIRTFESGAVLLGFGVTQRLGGHLSFRQDVVVAFGDTPNFTVQAGFGVPLGRNLTRRGGQAGHFGAARLRTGQHVWITQDDGREVEGAVGDIDDGSVEVLKRTGRTLIDASRVRRIEIADSPADGARRGAIVGGAAAGAIGVLAAFSLCEGSCGAEGLLFVGAAAGYGVGVGALIGALADSLHAGRRTILNRAETTLAVAPVLGHQRVGVRAAIAW